MIRNIYKILLLLIFPLSLISWGSLGHSTISRKCPESFPLNMVGFNVWSDSLRIHASDADTRKSSDPTESPKHYLDIDNYSEFISNGRIASTYDSIVKIHSASFVLSNGTLPWATLNTYDSLKVAFQKGNWHKAMLFASDLGHYVADGHMPLHITSNYDGQQTNQSGIHSRYESNMVSSYISSISDYSGTPAQQVSNVNEYVFNYIYKNYLYVDSVLAADKYATTLTGSTSSSQYYAALWSKTRFTTTLFKNASHALADLIYTAWMQAGSPPFGSIVINSTPDTSDLKIFAAYPNPTTGKLTLSDDNPSSVQVINVSGVIMGQFAEKQIDISNLANGMYIICTYTSNGILKKERVLLLK